MGEQSHGIERGAAFLDARIAAATAHEGVSQIAPIATSTTSASSIAAVLPANGARETGWPDPLPLVAKVEVEPYPLDALPDTIRAAVIEVQGFTKAPVPMVASSALAALSLAIQAHADITRADKLRGPVGLFLLTIADSGERKSTCDSFFTSAIRDFETQQAEAAKPLVKDYIAALEAWDAKRAGIKEKIRQLAKGGKQTAEQEAALRDLEDEKPEAPRVPKLLRGDDTPENLAWVLSREWPSSGVLSSEAGIVLGAHAMGKDSIMRNLGLLNILWDGGGLAIGRRTSESFTVRGARLTVALQVQEATLRSFFDRSSGLPRGTGFLARFLVAWPESTQGFRPFTEAPANWPSLTAFNRRIGAILNQRAPIDDDGALIPPLLALAPEAKTAWVAFHNAIEGELASGGELYDVRDVASKSADNAARLAALFHVFESGMGGAVGLEAFDGASRIAAWHLNESRRFFGELALPVELANAARLDSWLIEYCRRQRTHLVPIAKLQQGGPGVLRSKATIETAMRELEEAGRARWVRDGKRKMIAVNPALLIEGGAS
ncbi:MAG: YfjI family protein [Pseudomonadota bacterium]